LVAGLAVWAHTLAAVPLACGGIAAVVVGVRAGVPWARLLAAAGVVVGVAVALAAPAYWHLFVHLDGRASMGVRPLPSGVKYLVMDFLNDRAYQQPLDRRPLFHLLFVLATWQARADWRARAGRCEGLWLAGTLTLLFGYASGHAPVLSELQPYRFVVAGDLLLTVPAALGLGRLAAAVRAADRPGRVAFAVAALAFLPNLTGYGWDLAARPRAQPLPPDDQRCVDWVREHHTGGRVLCEPAAAGCLLPHLVGCEVIGGGVSAQAVVVQGWTHVGDGRAFGRPIEATTAADFLHKCRLFDVRLVVAESPALEALLTAGGGGTKVAEVGRYRIYRLTVEPVAPVWEGCYQGRVRAAHNRIVIDNPPAGRVVLNYHHARGFDGGPGVEVAPVDVGGGAPLLGVTVAAPADRVELVFRP
jgi:hypothetical protein